MADKPKKTKLTNKEAEQLARQVSELTEALQRERADATNLRRRHEEQLAGLKNMLKANVVRDLLPVIDNFERALKHMPDARSQQAAAKDPGEQRLLEWSEGVKKILSQFEKVLAQLGVERIATVDQPFDPRYHEAVSMEEGEGSKEVVSEELQAGYRLGGEVIRHAMVRVRLQ